MRVPRPGLRREDGRAPSAATRTCSTSARPGSPGCRRSATSWPSRSCKAAESVFSAVTCCSGCFSAYRREAILPHLDWWEKQMFLGRRVDVRRRPLADELRPARLEGPLRGEGGQPHDRPRDLPAVHEAADALEALLDARVADRRDVHLEEEPDRRDRDLHLGRAAAGRPDRRAPRDGLAADRARQRRAGRLPARHLRDRRWSTGSTSRLRQRRYDTLWLFGVLFVFFYLAFLLWQTYYAILTSRTRSWGTRAAQPAEVAS